MKKLLFAALSAIISLSTIAQELNCKVTVIAPQIALTDPALFVTMEEAIQNFMNGRKWTNDNFEFDERIDCNIQIT
ncbi:MAG: hypothetical protein ACI84C_002796, partial [Flavobacteriales bacterium]